MLLAPPEQLWSNELAVVNYELNNSKDCENHLFLLKKKERMLEWMQNDDDELILVCDQILSICETDLIVQQNSMFTLMKAKLRLGQNIDDLYGMFTKKFETSARAWKIAAQLNIIRGRYRTAHTCLQNALDRTVDEDEREQLQKQINCDFIQK